MKMDKAQDYFRDGMIKSFRAVRRPMASGWLLEFEGVSGSIWVMKLAKGGFRVFKSVDSIITTVEEITGKKPLQGFKVL